MKCYTDEVLILESLANVLNEYDLESLKLVKEYSIMGLPTQLSTLGIDQIVEQNSNMLSTALEQLNAVTVDRTKMVNFFENIYNADELFSTPLTTPLKNTAEIEDIRPDYLKSFNDTVHRTVEAIAKGTVKKEFLKARYINPSYLATTKRQLVKSTLTELNYQELIRTANREIPCEVTETFFTITVLPFLRTFNDEAKQMTIQTQQLLSEMSRGNDLITRFMKTYNAVGNSSLPGNTATLMSYYLFNIARMFMDICAYGSYMLARKMNAFTYNALRLTELYQKITSFFPENNAHFHENAVDGLLDDADDAGVMNDLMDGDASVLSAIAHRIRDEHQFLLAKDASYGDKFHSVMDQLEDQRDYDLSPYVNLEFVMTSIIKSVYTLEANCKDNTMTFDELKEKAGLHVALINRFASHVAGISDISVYTRAEGTEDTYRIYFAVTNELRGFSDEIEKLTRYVKDIHDHVDSMDERLFSNVNDEFSSSPLIGETRKFVNDFKSDFQDLVTQIVQGFFRRLRALDDFLTHLERSCDDQENEQEMDSLLSVNGDDFIKEAVLSGMEDDDLLYQELATTENTRAYLRSLEHRYGVQLITEAENDSNNDSGSNDNNSGGSGSSNSGNDNKKKEGDPNVSGSGEGSSDKENTNTNDDDNSEKDEKGNDGKKKKFVLSEMIKKMTDFFDTIIKKFLTSMDRQLEINKKWLANHKAELLGKKIRNREINNIYPYADDMPTYVVENIRSCVSVINGLTEEKLNGMDNSAIDKELFGFITINADSQIRDKMVQWYTSKDREMKPVTLKNAEIERRMKPMIDYCETFYNGLYKNVANALQDLKNAWKTKADSLSNAESSKIIYVNKQIKYFSGTILNCIRDRNYAYLKVMKTFIGPSKNNDNQDNTGNEKNQNGEKQQEQNNNKS